MTQELAKKVRWFISRYPLFVTRRAVDYIDCNDPAELIVITENDEQILYDLFTGTECYLKEYNSSEHTVTENEYRKQFAQRLRRIMYMRSFNQQRLSEASGISEHTLSKYMNGKSLPNTYTLFRLSRALSCDVVHILPDFTKYKKKDVKNHGADC